MNNIKVTRTMRGIYKVTLTDYNLEFNVEDLRNYGTVFGCDKWEAVSQDDRIDGLGTLYFETLREVKVYLQYFRPEQFGIRLEKKVA